MKGGHAPPHTTPLTSLLMATTMTETEVLIVGAGPTGLVLALWLARRGIRVRIIDKAAEPGMTSRALVVHARTLELYRQAGLADAVVEQGLRFDVINLWIRRTPVGRAVLGDMGTGLSPFPYLVIFPQDQHERLLIERLRQAGITVEWGVELLGFDQLPGQVRVRLRHPDGREERCDTAYLAGCDGARSRVREELGTSFSGSTYQHLFYVADVESTGPLMNHELHLDINQTDFLAIFPLKGEGNARLIGIVQEGGAEGKPLAWEDVSGGIAERMGVQIERVNWFSTYHVHHRVAGSFRKGRAFLLGDAAHIHSPVGGQGMNTGIGDAVNLAWKLADVLRDRAGADLLDSYEPERIAFARRLVATTDRAFVLVTSTGGIARFMRTRVVPRLIPFIFRFHGIRRFMFRTVSQIMIHYHGSVLSAGKAGPVEGGDRLPWTPDNFAVLDGMHWQVHVYGEADPDVMATCAARNLVVKVFPWESRMQQAGFRAGALYLVRPDGYVAFADLAQSAAALEHYLDSRRLKPGANSAPGR
jgi:2-polyprenyl-6-methoxyphenol hydroxylase-like FAD-dependent oxidoreductase